MRRNGCIVKRVKDFVFPIVLVIGLAVFAAAGRAPATGVDYVLDEEPEIIAATFSSAWCSSCKVLEPKLAAVAPEFSDKPVKFVKLNFTLGKTDAVETLAAENNITDIYERFKDATGFTLLIDADTGEVIDMLTMNHSKPVMRAMIAQAIAAASRNGA